MQKFRKATERIISLVLCVVMLSSLFLDGTISAVAADDVSITTGNTAVVNLKDTTVITADGTDNYQWQIYAENYELWVNIQGETAAELGLTFAMVSNMLGEDGTAKVRCKSINSVSEEVMVSVDYTVPEVEVEEEEITVPTEKMVPMPALMSLQNEISVAASYEDSIAPLADTDELGIPLCDCGYSGTDGLSAHGDGCARKSYIRNTYIVNKTAAEIYADWSKMDEETQNAVRSFLSWSDQSKLTELDSLIQQGNTEIENVTVTINYYLKGNIYGMPWTAIVAKGSDLVDMDVANYEILGYAPTLQTEVEGVTFTEDKVTLNLTNVQSNITINVVYQPALVKYTVNHYVQNVGDDNYTLELSEPQTGYTEATVESAEKTADDGEPWSGLIALVYNHPEIAADGSTSVDIYYNRNYYLMYFNLDGGYGVEPIYARYGAPVTGIGTPTKTGWTFSHWTPEIPATVPIGGGTYTAVWGNPQTVNYTVVYWRENADNTEYSYWGSSIKQATAGSVISGSDDVPTSVSNATVDGSTVNEKKYFTYNDSMTDKNVTIKGDGTTVINVYYYRNYYTIYFTGYGKCGIPEHTHSDACRTEDLLVCGHESHTHTEECNGTLVCTVPEHTHTSECCTILEHTHTNACCTVDEHTHTENCYTCTEHAHTVGCYTISYTDWWGNNTNATIATTASTNVDVNGTYGNGISYSGWQNNRKYYIEINGRYYQVSGLQSNDWVNQYEQADVSVKDTAHIHGDGSCTYRDTEHTHGDGYCTCSEAEHTHSDGNCMCELTAHIHTDACYSYSCGKSVHTHSADCYRECPIYKHTHTSTCTTNNSNNVLYTITAKYEADISALWPTYDKMKTDGYAYINGSNNVSNTSNSIFRGWKIDGVTDEAVSKRLNMTSDLCDTNDGVKRATAQYNASYTYHLYYMFESYYQDDDYVAPNGTVRREYNGVWYDSDPAYYQILKYSSDTTFGQKQIAGMKPEGVEKTTSGSGSSYVIYNYLYYSRNRYTLSYQNLDKIPKTETGIMFGSDLSTYTDTEGKLLKDYIPPYPAQYQEGLYTFDGWYTTPECFEGTRFNWANAVMPNGDLTLYAKWDPVIRTVRFYYTKEALENGDEPLDGKVYEVDNGAILVTLPEQPTRPPYNFVGWFYIADDGTEKAFDFSNMPITKDMKVYAKWDARVLVPYFIYFKTKDGDTSVGDVEVVIADYTDGEGVTGTTMTFFAKTGDELYEGYQTGYYPNTESHSLTFDIEDTSKNTFTFWYTKEDAVPYTVEYILLDEEGNEVGPAFYVDENGSKVSYTDVAEGDMYPEYTKYVENNYSTVVTEIFEIVPGYMPDAYSKRLIVTTEGENVITFYYSPNTTQAYYKISHWVEVETGQYIELTDYTTQNIGDIGTNIDVTGRQLSLPGYTYLETKWIHGTSTQVGTSATLDEYGLEFRFYYNRNSYPYISYYLEQGTGKTLAPFKYDDDALYKYGTRVYENAIVIPGYTALEAAKSHVITHEVIAAGAYPVSNVITFYYTENDITINYVPVTEDMGSVSVESETVKAVNGTVTGSVPTAKDGYKFVGWYTDEACTVPVTEEDGTVDADSNQFIPSKHTHTVSGTDISYDVYLPATYYAKFEEIQIPITYVAVTDTVNPVNFGTVQLNTNGTSGITITEKVNGMSGAPDGAIAVAGYTYKFEGWYADEECTQLLTTDASYVPTEVKEATYYAKFVEKQVRITYMAISVDGNMNTDIGTVNGKTMYNESVNIVSGPVNGATAAPGANYKFLGWYDAGNIATANILSLDSKYVPSKTDTVGQVAVYEAKTYYAIFEEIIGINYIAVDRSFSPLSDTIIGSVALNSDGNAAVSVTETLGEYTGSAVGATVAVTDAASDYLFTGWYYKAQDGTYKLVSDELSFIPPKNGDYNEAATYYARFIPTPTVTIEKVVTSNGEAVPQTELAGYKAEFQLVNNGNTVATATVQYDADGNAKPAGFVFVDDFDFTKLAKLELKEISCGYIYDQECVSTTFTGDANHVSTEEGRTYIKLNGDGSDVKVVCTNDYPVESYISITKALSFGDSIEESHKAEIIKAYYSGSTPAAVNFALTTKTDTGTVLATATAYVDAEGNFAAVKFIDVTTGRTFIPKIGETYVITETSNHAVTGYFWTHSAVEIIAEEAIESISYTNHYERPSVTITKEVISKDTAGNAVGDDELNRLIDRYAGGIYKATLILSDYEDNSVEAGSIVITFDDYDSNSTENRKRTVYLTEEYLQYLKEQNREANAPIKLVINEDHTNGATTILGSEYPGVSFNGAVEENNHKYVITLSTEAPTAEIVCINEYPPASYISVQKELDLTVAGTEEEIYMHYANNPNVQFVLYKNYGTENQELVANAMSIYDSNTKTFSKATFVAGEYGNAFEPEVGVSYTLVEVSTHRVGGYVWEKIGAGNSETISITVTADNPVSENTYTNKYTKVDVGLNIEKSLVFNDESGKPLSITDIERVLEDIEGNTKSYTATFGIWETTSGYQTKLQKIAEATVIIELKDFNGTNAAVRDTVITPLGDITDLNAYLKEKGEAESETYLLIVEESATEIASNKLDVDYGIVDGKLNESCDQYIVLGGAGTRNQVYSHIVVCRNTYPPTNLRTSLKIVKAEAVKGTIKDGEQFSFIVQTQIAGKNVEREIVIVWDSSKEENSVTITDIPLKTTVVVETGWGWRYAPDKNTKQMFLSIVESDNVITFTNTLENDQWLDDQVIVENHFAPVSTEETTN